MDIFAGAVLNTLTSAIGTALWQLSDPGPEARARILRTLAAALRKGATTLARAASRQKRE
ncbi:MAG: hypothetical protein DHS20C21_03400 [Gemmatimonadota bacterium]|nr:MAG: hypothetical protein DHS20C21_03400 [Gemmatimonadota bacterium]